jgi:hypothetical protein
MWQKIVRLVEYVEEMSSGPDYEKTLETAKRLIDASCTGHQGCHCIAGKAIRSLRLRRCFSNSGANLQFQEIHAE